MIRSALLDVGPFDLHATFEMQLLGKFDPTGSRNATSLRKVHLDARGNVVVWRFTQMPTALLIEVDGDDGGLLNAMTRQFPLADGAESFEPEHALLRRLSNGFRGLRLMRVPWTFDVAASSVLQQRVRWQTAFTDFRRIALRWGTPAHGAVAFPTSAQLAAVPPARLEAIGLDPKRARALHLLAQADARHAFLQPDADADAVDRRLLSIRGIGPWTAGRVAGLAFGNADAVPVGDLHIPSLVTSALAGEPDGTDERMLELLDAYPGQRFRVIRLLLWAARRVPHVFRQLPTARALTMIALTAAIVTAGCDTAARAPDRTPQLLTAGAAADTITPLLAARQRRLLAALAARDEDVADLIAERFTLFDAADTTGMSRDLRGRPAFGQDYFRVLNRDFPAALAQVVELQVLPEYNGSVLVIATHTGLPATLTSWELRAGTWKAIRMTINSTDDAVERTKAWYIDAAARASSR